jgi:hypothetical protein
MSSHIFELHKINKLKYELRYKNRLIHGNNNLFYSEIEAIEFYKKFISSWTCPHLEIKFKTKYIDRELIG